MEASGVIPLLGRKSREKPPRNICCRLFSTELFGYEEPSGRPAKLRGLGGGAEQGKTRTKDKYRVVYTDHQRLELEKEFHYSRYITIRRKSELAANLGLTERQVKIWFQNRRAKERKVNKKKQQQQPPAPQLTPALDTLEGTPTSVGPPLGGLDPSNTGLLGASSPVPVKEEFLP
ncbi:homeobox protein CDX-1 [Fukomys damarensis]|uniref:Homeobox protein CDX-1 n=1 Tax=Fukomys damarensis TaxID=885580 RepID=A0A091E9W1_FUKDA|nr:homeobox protein CDX-1 [Fukomys damarensis]KFO32006.1 Homeobox protein CDX-1 [Fukomys damarensis]